MFKYKKELTILLTTIILFGFVYFKSDRVEQRLDNIVVNVDEQLLGGSTLFAQNASVQLNLEVFGSYASTSGNLSFNGEIMPDGATCSNGQILKRTGANDWDCAADGGGAGDKTFGWIDANNSGGTFVSIGSLSFDANHFTFSNTASEGYLRLDWDSVASLSTAETITGNWVNTTNPWADDEVADTITLNGGTIGNNTLSAGATFTGSASISANLEIVGYASISNTFVAGLNASGKKWSAFGATYASRFNSSTLVQYADEDGLNSDWAFRVAGTGHPVANFAKSTGTLASASAIAAGDDLGEISFLGWKQGIFREAAEILGEASAINGNNVAGQLRLGVANYDGTISYGVFIDTDSANNMRVGINDVSPQTTLDIAGSASVSTNFEIVGFASASLYQGTAFGGIDCNDATDQLLWSGGLFTCEALADGDIPDTITLAGGTIGSNNISATSTWTTLGTLTIGDNGDNIAMDSNTWDISAAGVGSGFTGFTSTGVVDFGGADSLEAPNASGGTTVNAAGEFTIDTASDSWNFYNGTAERVIKTKSCFGVDYPSPTAKDHITIWNAYDPFTISEVFMIASGSNSVGWQIRHGTTVAGLTGLFSVNHQASGSNQVRYTTFNDATVADSERVDFVITSASANIDNIFVRACGYYDP